MSQRFSRGLWPAVLALAFAVHVGMTVSLTGRLQGAAFAAAQAFGALALAVIAAGRPVAAVQAMTQPARMLALAGGLLGILGPIAVVAGTRMSDAPAGSVVVFWVAGGWALIAAIAAAVLAARRADRTSAGVAVAAGLVAFVGAAGVVANWERPSSFSPLVRFPVQELTMLAGGALLLAGAYLILRAARGSHLHGALVCSTGIAAAAGAAWWAVTGFAGGWSSLGERPVQVAIAALAWGAVCLSLPRVADREGPARVGALLAAAPVLLTTLIWLEQAVGVAGPQPLIVSGVIAGSVTLAAGSAVLWSSVRVRDAASLRWQVRAAAALPLALSAVALLLPAITAHAEVDGPGGAFSGSWTLLGWESLAGVTAFALAALLLASVSSRGSFMPPIAGILACAAWPLTLSTPMHVLTGWLPPGLEQYYGTEYASIGFTGASAPVMVAALVTCALGFSALLVSGMLSRSRPDTARSGR